MRCQGICAANRGNIPPAINDTGFLSATQGMYDMIIRMILARCRYGKIAAGGVSVCVLHLSAQGKCVYMYVCV